MTEIQEAKLRYVIAEQLPPYDPRVEVLRSWWKWVYKRVIGNEPMPSGDVVAEIVADIIGTRPIESKQPGLQTGEQTEFSVS